MVAEPAATPATTPDAVTVAIAVLLLLQVPPDVASVNVVELPLHTEAAPAMVPAPGAAETVTRMVVNELSVPSATFTLKLSVPV